MGTWGTGISSNDTYADIYDDFMDKYNDGMAVADITTQLLNENQETIDIKEDAPNFWFALANAQWECAALDTEILSKVERIIQSGEDLEIWKELGGTTADIKAREKALIKFLAKIQTPKVKPKKRVKKKFVSSIFKKGDCLTYLMDNGNYGGAFVLTDEENTPLGLNHIVVTTIDKPTKPFLNDFKIADVYVKRAKKTTYKNGQFLDKWGDDPDINGYTALYFNKEKINIEIEVIGQLNVYKPYFNDLQSMVGWHNLRTAIPFKEEYVKINGAPKLTLKLSNWTKPSWLRKLFGK